MMWQRNQTTKWDFKCRGGLNFLAKPESNIEDWKFNDCQGKKIVCA